MNIQNCSFKSNMPLGGKYVVFSGIADWHGASLRLGSHECEDSLVIVDVYDIIVGCFQFFRNE